MGHLQIGRILLFLGIFLGAVSSFAEHADTDKGQCCENPSRYPGPPATESVLDRKINDKLIGPNDGDTKTKLKIINVVDSAWHDEIEGFSKPELIQREAEAVVKLLRRSFKNLSDDERKELREALNYPIHKLYYGRRTDSEKRVLKEHFERILGPNPDDEIDKLVYESLMNYEFDPYAKPKKARAKKPIQPQVTRHYRSNGMSDGFQWIKGAPPSGL